jgi:NADH dehydrogenase FAD-containing subunit
VFAVGDVTTYLPGMAGFAGMQAGVVAATISARINGEDEPAGYQPLPPVIVVPVGPEGGAGQLPGMDGIAGPEQVAEIKGRTLMVERFQGMFGPS